MRWQRITDTQWKIEYCHAHFVSFTATSNLVHSLQIPIKLSSFSSGSIFDPLCWPWMDAQGRSQMDIEPNCLRCFEERKALLLSALTSPQCEALGLFLGQKLCFLFTLSYGWELKHKQEVLQDRKKKWSLSISSIRHSNKWTRSVIWQSMNETPSRQGLLKGFVFFKGYGR